MNKCEIKLPAEFQSGNSVPVERATITRQRMAEILAAAIEADRKRRGEPVAWQPIETAPKDGTTILVWFKQHGAMTVCWGDRDYDHTSEYAIWLVDDHKHGPYPVRGYSRGDDTHWMPLPPAPQPQQQAGERDACSECGGDGAGGVHEDDCKYAPQPQQIPEGYKLVPTEPTDEMIEAGCALYDSSLRQRYKAMLEAAPEVKP